MDFNIENVSRVENKAEYVAEKRASSDAEKKPIDEVKDVAEIISGKQEQSNSVPVVISKDDLQRFLSLLMPSGTIMGLHENLGNNSHLQKIGKLLKGS